MTVLLFTPPLSQHPLLSRSRRFGLPSPPAPPLFFPGARQGEQGFFGTTCCFFSLTRTQHQFFFFPRFDLRVSAREGDMTDPFGVVFCLLEFFYFRIPPNPNGPAFCSLTLLFFSKVFLLGLPSPAESNGNFYTKAFLDSHVEGSIFFPASPFATIASFLSRKGCRVCPFSDIFGRPFYLFVKVPDLSHCRMELETKSLCLGLRDHPDLFFSRPSSVSATSMKIPQSAPFLPFDWFYCQVRLYIFPLLLHPFCMFLF